MNAVLPGVRQDLRQVFPHQGLATPGDVRYHTRVPRIVQHPENGFLREVIPVL
jgi:hypothetical protein